jgi:FkbM family methyltransferase
VITNRLIAVARPIVDRFPRVAATYRSVRDQLDDMDEPTMTPWGFTLAGNEGMAIGTFERAETELVRNVVAELDLLVNVGANIGYYCCHALSLGKPIIAFEPVPRNVRYLCKNLIANGWSDAEVYPIALTDKVGVLKIYGGGTGASLLEGWAGTPRGYATLAPSSTMDIMLASRLKGKKALIVADVEGAEQLLLDGATSLLANDPKPVWMVEIMVEDHQPAGVHRNPHLLTTFQTFFRSGYQAFSIGDCLRRVTAGDLEAVSTGARSLSSHNFLFLATPSS